VSKHEMEEVTVLWNLITSTQEKDVDKKENPQKIPEQPKRVNEPQIKYSMPVKESAWAREVVQMAQEVENPFQNHMPISQVEDLRTTSQWRDIASNTVVEKTVLEMEQKVYNLSMRLSTRVELPSILPDVCQHIREPVMTKQILQAGQAATIAFSEKKTEGGDPGG